jgi:hypothetical protein
VRKPTDGQLAIGALIAFALWIFVALPLYYGPRDSNNPAAYNCSAEQEKNYGFWEKARCDPVAYFTAWLVGFTGILAVSTIGLWGVTLWASLRQSRDMEASITVAKQSADAALRVAENAERALHSLEIPRVFPVNLNFTVLEDVSLAPYKTEISISLKNFGRSPAFLTRAYFKVSVTDAGNPRRIVYSSGIVPFMTDDVIGDKEIFGPVTAEISELVQHAYRIRHGTLRLNLLVHHDIDDALENSSGRSAWYVWNPARDKFVSGVQLWTEN